MTMNVIIAGADAENMRGAQAAVREAGFDPIATFSEEEALASIRRTEKPFAVITGGAFDQAAHDRMAAVAKPKGAIMIKAFVGVSRPDHSAAKAYFVEHIVPALVAARGVKRTSTVAIVVGSTRPGRKAEVVARWVHAIASKRDDATFEVVDLADFALPLLDEPTPPAMGPPIHEHTKRWAATIDKFDAYVFVTPEYNRGPPGALKNAIDFLYREWHNKAAGFVSYGVTGGTCAVEQLRLVMGELQVADVRTHVGLSLSTDFENFTTFRPAERHTRAVTQMLDQLVAWADALRTVRENQRPVVHAA